MNMVLKNEWCETCGEKCHKAATYPFRTVIEYCYNNKQHEHATFDCPFKKASKDASDPNLEEEFHKFMSEIGQKKEANALSTDEMSLVLENDSGSGVTSPFDIPNAKVTYKGSIEKIDPSKVRILNPNLDAFICARWINFIIVVYFFLTLIVRSSFLMVYK